MWPWPVRMVTGLKHTKWSLHHEDHFAGNWCDLGLWGWWPDWSTSSDPCNMKTILQAILKWNKQKHPLINSTHKWINQDKENNAQYSVVSLRPHPPTNRAQNPCWRVGLFSEALPPPTHPPTGNPPLSGVLPLCTVGTYQLPRSQKQTPSTLPPPFLTVVTAMSSVTL